MFWNDRRRLIEIARGVRGIGWLVAALVLVAGTVMAARDDGQQALLLRALLAASVLAVGTTLAWLIERYAKGIAVR
jgi:hypothetical protein